MIAQCEARGMGEEEEGHTEWECSLSIWEQKGLAEMMTLEKAQERQVESQEAGKGADMGGRRDFEDIGTGERQVLGPSGWGAFEYMLVGQIKW